MKQQNSRNVQAIANIIKKLKSSSGSKRDKYISKVKKQFKFDDNEKWVVTKLRMLLFRQEVDLDLLQIQKSRKSSPKKQKSYVTKSPKDSILMEAQRLKERKEYILVGKVARNNNNEKGRNKVSHTRTKQEKVRRKRQTLEEKQLTKLR